MYATSFFFFWNLTSSFADKPNQIVTWHFWFCYNYNEDHPIVHGQQLRSQK